MPLQHVTYNSAMKLEFTKMHGAGNDFVVLDGYSRSEERRVGKECLE